MWDHAVKMWNIANIVEGNETMHSKQVKRNWTKDVHHTPHSSADTHKTSGGHISSTEPHYRLLRHYNKRTMR